MVKQKMWVKRRTSRGNGRPVRRRDLRTVRNIDRDVRKNQVVYSWYFLKFVLIFAFGLIWLRLGINLGSITALPIGFIVGLTIVLSEKIKASRKFEIGLLVASAVLSYFLPIGLVI